VCQNELRRPPHQLASDPHAVGAPDGLELRANRTASWSAAATRSPAAAGGRQNPPPDSTATAPSRREHIRRWSRPATRPGDRTMSEAWGPCSPEPRHARAGTRSRSGCRSCHTGMDPRRGGHPPPRQFRRRACRRTTAQARRGAEPLVESAGERADNRAVSPPPPQSPETALSPSAKYGPPCRTAAPFRSRPARRGAVS